jgi:hypothetical protein
MLHASHNLFIQAIFDRMTNPVGKALYVTTEFGFGLALTVAACAFYLWTRRGEVEGLSLHDLTTKDGLNSSAAPADISPSLRPS